MDKLHSLDNRLQMCASLVRNGARLADIGTDHAYLPVWLLKNGRISYAIASDINSAPLDMGRSHAEKYRAEGIEFRLGAGLSTLSEQDRVTDIVIAGMGGEVIANILAESALSKNPEINFILQPMTKSEELILYLTKNGFRLTAQSCATCKGKCYTVIAAKYCNENDEKDELYPYTGILDLTDEDSRRFVQNHIKHLRNKSNGDPKLLPLADRLEKLIL